MSPRRVCDLLRVGAKPVRLSAIDPANTPGIPAMDQRTDRKEWARAEVARLGSILAGEQEKLYARSRFGGRQRVLLVLQAMDCGGKDGVIKNVVGRLNPAGVRVHAFGPPTEAERSRGFLWRIRQVLPGPGYLAVFNRSHYEDVVAARVRGLVPPWVWRRRYGDINEFERQLAVDEVTVLKVMLHISREEQRRRLRRRLEDPTKQWKFDPGDIADRDRWQDFEAAYDEALTRCTSPAAPWFVVPADHKWYRDWAVANLLVNGLVALNLSYPDISPETAAVWAKQLGEVEVSHEHEVNNE